MGKWEINNGKDGVMNKYSGAIGHLKGLKTKNCEWIRRDVIDLAVEAFAEKAERENPQPLTLEQLKERVGEPVYVVGTSEEWGIVLEDRVETSTLYYLFSEFNNLDKFYTHEPMEGEIIKTPKPTILEQQAIDFYKKWGCSWIAKSKATKSV